METLLKHPNINVNSKDGGGSSALIWATKASPGMQLSEAEKMVKTLLKHPNIDVNSQDRDGNTALMLAYQYNRGGAMYALLEHPNINVNIKNKKGETALDLTKGYHKDVVDELKAKGAKRGSEL